MTTLTDVVERLIKAVKLISHPVGSIYMSTVSTSPANLFGGKWVQITDRFLWCAGTSHAAGSTGGEETHKLTIAEMPSHTHSFLNPPMSWADRDTTSDDIISPPSGTARGRYFTTNSTGGNGAHNNMPPYLAVYAWKRTA